MTDPLLPCPFCSCTKMTLRLENGSITCDDCKASALSIEKWNTRHTGWISVKEQLPEKGDLVLGWSTHWDEVVFVHYDVKENKFMFDTGDFLMPENVSHWMPLPALPENNQ